MSDRFITTRWSLIIAAGRDDEQAHGALTELCETYWRPVYAYVRRHGHRPDLAADLTQSFFVHLLEHRGFERADPTRGRFRAYVLTSVRNFLANARERDGALRRGDEARSRSIDVDGAERTLVSNCRIRIARPRRHSSVSGRFGQSSEHSRD